MSRMAYDAGNGGAVGGGPGGNGSGTAAPEDVNIIAPKYRHLPIADSADKQETYLTLAFEAAILALSKQRIMPHGLYAQHVICKQQDQLIQRLRSIDLDSVLVGVLRKLSVQLLDGGPTSGLGEMIHPESVPMHTLARFLFASLLNQHSDLAFEIGLRAMRFPILENINEGASVNGIELQHNNFMHSPYPRWWTLGHLETQQCSLSSTMLSAAKGDTKRLSAVLQNARRNIHSSSHLFKLAQDAFRFATPENGPRSQTLLGVAFELGLQVMRMTLTCLNWRRREMVRWLVTCASHVGIDALMSIMQNWYHLFTPTEATGPVATTIMSHSTIMRLNLNFRQQDELSNCARTLALQCATKDPPNCALNALTLSHISPRHYSDFIDFLSKARDTFMLARDGPAHFSRLIENITIAYKGKKKLVRQNII
uniref:ZSWIM4-8 C-terminal domain-containing protein n=1 Tax=Anopheles melas TaxID=34690 RepID=A0A182U5P2_9DIPT